MGKIGSQLFSTLSLASSGKVSPATHDTVAHLQLLLLCRQAEPLRIGSMVGGDGGRRWLEHKKQIEVSN